MKDSIISHLSPDYPWKDRFHYFPCIDSTNDQLKAMARQGAEHGTVLIAGHQTGGHGRLGRNFHSPEGMGTYLSILLRPDCTPSQLMHLTCSAAVAMCDAVEKTALFRPGIKWTNDLVQGKRKLGGILTELGLNPKGGVDYAIIGVGINCRQMEADFSPDIRDMAGSLSMVTGTQIAPGRMAAAMMEALHEMDAKLPACQEEILQRYRADCITIGQDISLVRGDEVRYGKALDVDENGALLVAFADGRTEAVNSGEVSIRGMYGYI